MKRLKSSKTYTALALVSAPFIIVGMLIFVLGAIILGLILSPFVKAAGDEN